MPACILCNPRKPGTSDARRSREDEWFREHCRLLSRGNGNVILVYHCIGMIDHEEGPGLMSTSGLCHLSIDLNVD
jgi:hypothetical protein